MSGGWLPWRRLVWAWVPALILLVVMIAVFVWQTSDSLGREAQLSDSVRKLKDSLARLENVELDLEMDRTSAAALDEEMRYVYEDIFGNLDERLVDIMQAIEDATRGAGLLPTSFSYGSNRNKDSAVFRFGISFSVTGRYEQIRQMIGAIQSSSEFLIIESVSFRGEEQATTRDIRISVKVATVLSSADAANLRLLTSESYSEIESVEQSKTVHEDPLVNEDITDG